MEVQDYLKQYIDLNVYFAPDYEQENEVLDRFKSENAYLSNKHVMDLKKILQSHSDITHKYFVADLLYLYVPFTLELLDPLLECAIAHEDPSFNRIFLRPCVSSFGLETVTTLLDEKGRKDDTKLAGIKRLKYWLHPPENWK